MYSGWDEMYGMGPPMGYRPRGRGRGRGARGGSRGRNQKQFTNTQYADQFPDWSPVPATPKETPMQASQKYAKELEKVKSAAKKIEQEQEKAAKEIFDKKVKEKMDMLAVQYARNKPLVDVIRRILTSDKPNMELSAIHCELYLSKDNTSLTTVCDVTIRITNPGIYSGEVYGGTFQHRSALTVDPRIMEKLMSGHEIVAWPGLFKTFLKDRQEKDPNYSVETDSGFTMAKILTNVIHIEPAEHGINTSSELRKHGTSYNIAAWEFGPLHSAPVGASSSSLTHGSFGVAASSPLAYTEGDIVAIRSHGAFVVDKAVGPGLGTFSAFKINKFKADLYRLSDLIKPDGFTDADVFEVASAIIRYGTSVVLTPTMDLSTGTLLANLTGLTSDSGKVYMSSGDFKKGNFVARTL